MKWLGLSFLRIPMFVGQINVKLASRALFSERYGKVPVLRLGPIMLTWRRWRTIGPGPLADDIALLDKIRRR